MRPVCVICTETLLINSVMSACPCGHVFHEECLMRWLRSSPNSTCPQCRARVRESAIVKKLYLTEENNIMSTQLLISSVPVGGDEGGSSDSNERFEQLISKIQELKAELKDRDDSIALKSRLIEQKDNKIKELEEFKTNIKKKLNENQMLIDYLKKELENFSKLKDQFNTREKCIIDLENRIKEFRTIEMIYKDHEDQFSAELKKYIVPNMSQSHSQSVIRHLVSANVLLKEQVDRQSEEKNDMRKKLLQMERERNDREKAFMEKQNECTGLRERMRKMEDELERRSTSELLEAAIGFKKSTDVIASPSKTLTRTTPAPQTATVAAAAKDEDLKSLTKIFINDTFDDDEDENQIPLSQQKQQQQQQQTKKRKKSDEVEITSYQNKSRPVDEDEEDEVILSVVMPMSSSTTNSSKQIQHRPLYKTNSFSGHQFVSNNKSNKPKLDESVQIIPLNHPSGGFSYQYDGLGGRKKIFKADSSDSYSINKAGFNRIFKFKPS